MSQLVTYWIADEVVTRELPDAGEAVMPGVTWGDFSNLFTPAYWVSQLWMAGLDFQKTSPYQAQGSLAEEITFCMLGGFGITAELATGAFDACKAAGLIDQHNASSTDWTEVLREPIAVEGRTVKYRYPNQKAIYLAEAMAFLQQGSPDLSSGQGLRNSLLKIRGVGPKTAGWVARNFLDADDVAILDIHLIRACQLCDLYTPQQKVEREYFEMEARYIEFCQALSVRPAVIDCLIWDQMRVLGNVPLDALRYKAAKNVDFSPHKRRNLQYSLAL